MKKSKILALAIAFSLIPGCIVNSPRVMSLPLTAQAESPDEGYLYLDYEGAVTVFDHTVSTVRPIIPKEIKNVVSLSFDVHVSDDFSDVSVAGTYEDVKVTESDGLFHVSIENAEGISSQSPVEVTFTSGEPDTSGYIEIINVEYRFKTGNGEASYSGKGTNIRVTDAMYIDDDEFNYFVYKDHAEIRWISDDLTYVTIPAEFDGLPVSSVDLFYNSSLKFIDCDKTSQYFSSYDGVLFSKDKSALIAFPKAKETDSYEIPSTVTSISDYAFNEPVHLKKLVIPASVTEIAERAVIQGTDDFVIYGYSGTAAEQYARTHYISFYDMESGMITAPDISGSCGDNMTYHLDEYGVMTISGTGEMGPFPQVPFASQAPWADYMRYIKELVVEEGVTNISACAFARSDNLTKATLPDSLTVIDYEAFLNCFSMKTIDLPSDLQEIRTMAFYGVPLEGLELPGSLKIIGNQALSGTYHNDIIFIPESVEEIGWSALDSFDAIEADEDNPYFSSYKGVLYNKEKTEILEIPSRIKELELSEGISTFDQWDFPGSRYLQSVVIPSTLTKICSSPFVNCPALSSIAVASGNKDYYSIDDVLYDKDGTLLCYPAVKSGTAYSVLDGTVTIDACAFDECKALKEVTIPASVSKIGYDYCENKIQRYIVSDSNPFYSSYEGVIYNKEKTTVIAVPGGLDTLIIPDTFSKLNMIDSESNFKVCSSSLQTLILPETVKSFSADVFGDYFGELRDIYYPGSKEDLTITGTNTDVFPEQVTIHYNMSGPSYSSSDINGDGEFSIADVVICQKYLLGRYRFNFSQWKAADLTGDGTVNVFDLIVFKEQLVR